MDHMASKLFQAGYIDAAIITPTVSAQVTIHTEKVVHITSMLGGIGYTITGTTDEVQDKSLSNSSNNTTTTTPAHHGINIKWIIVAVVLGVLILASVSVIAFFVLRRVRRGKQAYGAVGGKKSAATIEKDVFDAEMHDQEVEALQGMTPDLRERNFESGYDNVNSQYDGSDYDLGARHGVKRAKYGA